MTKSEIPPPSRISCCSLKWGSYVRILAGALVLAAALYAAFFYPPGLPDATRLGALEQRLDSIEKKVGAVTPPAEATGAPVPLGPLTEEVDKLKAQVENKDSQTQQAAQKFVAEAFAFWDLREAVRNGQAFGPQLDTLRAAAAGHREILDLAAKLDPYVLVTPMSVAQLRDHFATEAKIAATPVEASSFTAKIKSVFEPLISVKTLHDPRFADVEAALDSGNAPAALEAVKALPDDLQKGLASWRTKLEARVTLDDIVRALAVRFASPPSEDKPQ